VRCAYSLELVELDGTRHALHRATQRQLSVSALCCAARCDAWSGVFQQFRASASEFPLVSASTFTLHVTQCIVQWKTTFYCSLNLFFRLVKHLYTNYIKHNHTLIYLDVLISVRDLVPCSIASSTNHHFYRRIKIINMTYYDFMIIFLCI